MKLRSFGQLSSLALAIAGVYSLAPAAQAHHTPVHSAEQAVTETVASPASTLPLAVGGSVLLGVAATSSYYVLKRRS